MKAKTRLNSFRCKHQPWRSAMIPQRRIAALRRQDVQVFADKILQNHCISGNKKSLYLSLETVHILCIRSSSTYFRMIKDTKNDQLMQLTNWCNWPKTPDKLELKSKMGTKNMPKMEAWRLLLQASSDPQFFSFLADEELILRKSCVMYLCDEYSTLWLLIHIRNVFQISYLGGDCDIVDIGKSFSS